MQIQVGRRNLRLYWPFPWRLKHDPSVFLVKRKNVVNSRFGRFLHGFQETFPHRERKMLNAYFKFVQQVISHLFLF